MNNLIMMTAKKPPASQDSGLMTLKDVMAHVRIGETKIARMVQLETFPAPIKLGGNRLWSRVAIHSWVAAQTDSEE